jgi:hypothetical protein
LAAYRGQTAVLASMHRKEAVIAPLLKTHLGLTLQVLPNFNTDQFGTFSRERSRPGSQLETVRLKAQAALQLTDTTLAIASEGSFGPHPSLPYLACNRELVLWLDNRQNLEIVGEALSVETNFRHQSVTTLSEALAFAQQIGFPEHGLMVMPQPDWQDQPGQTIVKGILTEAELSVAIQATLTEFGKAHLETDMRAHYNPTRMRVIAAATQDLIQKLGQFCPQCQKPGFARHHSIPGLPCQLCQAPTHLPLAEIYACPHCDYQQEQPVSPTAQPAAGPAYADPSYCDYCNP